VSRTIPATRPTASKAPPAANASLRRDAGGGITASMGSQSGSGTALETNCGTYPVSGRRMCTACAFRVVVLPEAFPQSRSLHPDDAVLVLVEIRAPAQSFHGDRVFLYRGRFAREASLADIPEYLREVPAARELRRCEQDGKLRLLFPKARGIRSRLIRRCRAHRHIIPAGSHSEPRQ